MALTRVQATGKVRLDTGSPLVLTFTTPPTVGNGVLVLVVNRRAAGPVLPASLTDSQGNTYPQAAQVTFSSDCAAIYYCAAVGTSGTPFTIAINAGGGLYAGAAIEVSGVGSPGLVLDQTATAHSSGTTVTAGPTAALTASEVLLAGVYQYNTNLSSSVVEALSPAWVEEFEELNFSAYVAGEGATRILPSGASGTTPRAQWAVSGGGSYCAVVAAFAASGPTAITGTAALTLDAATVSGAGDFATAGTAAITLASVSLAAAGVLAPLGGGTVPPAPGPPVVDAQTGRALRLFVEIKGRTPVTPGAEVPRWILAAETGLRDPATWHGGHKPARLVSVSPITRELSDELRAVECRIVIADVDRLFRTYGTWGPLTGDYCAVYVVSDDVRYDEGEPYRLFAGLIQSHRALSGFQYEFVVQDVLATRLARLDATPRIPPYRLTLADFPGMDEHLEGQAAQIVLGVASDEAIPLPDRGPQGVVPPQRLGVVNFAALWGGSAIEADAYIWSQSALVTNGVWHVYYNPPDTPDVRQVIPDASYGVDVWTPGKPGWAMTGLATDYVDYAGRRYTPFFVRRDHPLAQAAREGKVLLAGNLYGVSDAGDGSGVVLDSAARLWQWLIVNQLFVPYTTGDFADVPLLDAVYGILDTDSVEAAHGAHVARLAGGYVVGLLLGTEGKQETLRHVLGELCAGTDLEQGINRHGQAMLAVEDVEAPAVATFTDLHDIEEGQFETWVDAEAYVDRIEHQYGWRYVPPSAPTSTPAEGAPLPKTAIPKAQQQWTSGLVVTEHAAARALHSEQPPRTKAVENRVVRSPAVAANLATTWLARGVGPEPMYEGPLAFRLTTGWQGLGVTTGVPIDLGTVIAITHLEGYGQQGYVTERGVVRRITVDPQQARVTLEGRLLTPTSPAIPPPEPEPTGLFRVQAASATATSATTIAVTFATPLVVGHGVVVALLCNTGAPTGFAAATCTDNHGHTYLKAIGQQDGLGIGSITCYYCPITTATGGVSTITVAPGVGAQDFAIGAIEVGGVGAGLAVEMSVGGGGISGTPGTTTPGPSTAPNLLGIAAVFVRAAQASIGVATADGMTPGWLQEGEALAFGSGGAFAGEVDSRILTTATAHALQVNWTLAGAGWWADALVGFKAT